jgi:glycosyltransferase involved in cell wall biosynthesis
MKIIFDASLIANTHTGLIPNPKTGVFRVAEKILENLEFNNFDISYASTGSLPELITFLEQKPHPCANSKSSQLKAKIIRPVYSVMPRKGYVSRYLRSIYWQKGLELINTYHYDKVDLKKYDIFHSPSHPLPKELADVNSIKKILTFHDLIPLILPEYKGKNIEKFMQRTLDGIDETTFVACVSESAKNDLLNYHPKANPERVSVIPLAADPAIFYQEKDKNKTKSILKKYRIDDSKPYVLLCSTAEKRKNLKRSIAAYIKLIEQENLKDLQLVMLGSDGWKIAPLFDNHKSVRKNVVITGFVEDEDLAAIYSEALAFVYPSIYEGFGLPPLEAMYCGTPVITANNSSLPEVVGDAALMVNATDEEAIADAMLKIYQNAELKANLSEKSIIQAQKFSWQKFKDDYLELYNLIHLS